MTSSLAIVLRLPYSYRLGQFAQNARRAAGLNRDGMLKMRRQAAVARHRGPMILEDLHCALAHIHHRFKRQYHAGLQPRPLTRLAVVRDLRLLMKLPPDAVSDKIGDDREAGGLRNLLDRMRNVRKTVANHRLGDTSVERLLGHPQQLSHARIDVADRHGYGRIAVKTFDD